MQIKVLEVLLWYDIGFAKFRIACTIYIQILSMGYRIVNIKTPKRGIRYRI